MSLWNRAADIFVGREREMDQLRAALEEAMSGQGRMVMLSGEPGIGKTHIAQVLAGIAVERGAQVLWGGCYENGPISLPYLPFVEALRAYVLSSEADDLQPTLSVSLSELARIVPEVHLKTHVEFRPPGDPEEDRFRLLQAVSDVLINAASIQPLMLVLEDLHDADSGTLDLLTRVAHDIGGANLLIVGTYRDAAVDRSHPLSRTMAGLSRIPGFKRIPMRGLAAEEIRQIASSVTGKEIALGLAEAVERETEGNPLFVQEVVRHLIEQGLLSREEARLQVPGDEALVSRTPEGLREIIGMRLSRLSDDCNHLLDIVSVIGREFNLAVLQRIAMISEDSFYSALKEAQSAGVIKEHSSVGAVVTYRFVHALFRQTIYEEILAPRRIRLHQQVAIALDDVYPTRLDEHAAELAKHYSYSSEAADLAKTVEYSETAAKQAMSVYAYGEAARMLEQALRAQEEVDPEGISRRCDLVLGLGEALLPAGEAQRVVAEIAVRALELADLLGDNERAIRACNLALWGLRRYGGLAVLSTTEFRYWAEQADRHALPGTIERAQTDIALSGLQISTGQTSDGIALMRQALELARDLDHPETYFWAVAVLLDGATAPQHQVELRQLATESEQWPRAGVNAGTLGVFLMHNGLVHLAWGDREGAEGLWAELEELATRTHDAYVLMRPLRNRAILEVIDGQLESALATAARLVEQAGELGNQRFGRFLASQTTFRPLLHLGRADKALEGLTEGYQFGERLPTHVSQRRALCLAYMGQNVESQAILYERIEQLDRGTRRDETPVLALVELLETATLLEDRTAAALLRDLLANLAPLISVPAVTCVARHLGAASILLEDWAAAGSYTEKALEVATRMRFRPEIALARLQLAELLLGQRSMEQAEALEHLEFAIPELADMTMSPSLRRASSLQEQVLSQRSGRPAYPDGLTRREVEVLQLVCGGKTDREIGEELFISFRTVGQHLSNILTKTNTVNRTEAAIYASEHGLL